MTGTIAIEFTRCLRLVQTTIPRLAAWVWWNQNQPGSSIISTDFLTKQRILPILEFVASQRDDHAERYPVRQRRIGRHAFRQRKCPNASPKTPCFIQIVERAGDRRSRERTGLRTQRLMQPLRIERALRPAVKEQL